MSYILKLTPEAIKDIDFHKKNGDKVILKKISTLFNELIEHPTSGTGQPEKLKHEFSGCWSRRINQKHRLVYRIEEVEVIVIVLQAAGHYTK